MSRAAILPAIGDPFLLQAWAKSYSFFKDEIDNLYILFNCAIDKSVMDHMEKLYKDLGAITFVKNVTTQHGDNIRFLLEQCKEDYVVLLEDDVIVKKNGGQSIGQCFEAIERGEVDIVGSTRGCCDIPLINAVVKKFNLTGNSPEHPLAQCPYLWPSLLFAKTSTLLQTDRNFNSKGWSAGEYIKEIDFAVPFQSYGDTFVWASIQLRAMGCRIGYVHQCHAGPDDLHNNQLNSAAWIHYGSLSSGVLGILMDENNTPLGYRTSAKETKSSYPVYREDTVQEFARRIAFFYLLASYYELPSELKYFEDMYIAAVNRFIASYPIPMSKLNPYLHIIKQQLPEIFED